MRPGLPDALLLQDRPKRVPVTPEWLEENRQKQAAYEKQRRAWVLSQGFRDASESGANAPQRSEETTG